MYSAGIAKPLHPDLWVPGRKPLGAVEVDWSHPITRDLVVCLPFRESCGNTIRNLARPANDGVIEGGAINPSWLHTPGGVGLGIDQSGSSARNYGVDLGPNPATGQTPRTVFLVTYKRGTGANNYIVSLGPSASATDQDWRFRYDEGSASELRIEITGSFYRSSLIPPIGQVNAIACSYGGGSLGDHFLYLNGQYEKASGTTTPNTGGDFHFLAADPWSFTSSTSTGTTDVILFYCMWLRQLSHDEIFELTENPYQLLRPRTNFFWVPAVGGNVIELTITDSVLIPDQDEMLQDKVMRSQVLLCDDAPKLVEKLALDKLVVSDAITYEALIEVLDRLLVSDEKVAENLKIQLDRLLVSDQTEKEIEKIAVDRLLLYDDVVAQVVSDAITLTITDGLLLLDETVRQHEKIVDESLLLQDAVIKQLEVTARDFLLLADERAKELSVRIMSHLMLSDVMMKEHGMTVVDRLLLRSIISKMQEKIVSDGVLVSDSVTTQKIVAGVVQALVFAALKAVDLLGITIGHQDDLLGITIGHQDDSEGP